MDLKHTTMIKNFDYMVRKGNVIARYPFMNIEHAGEVLLESEMDLILNNLMKEKEISTDGYGTIGIDEKENTLHVMEVVTNNELWEEQDYGVYIFNRDLKEIRGY